MDMRTFLETIPPSRRKSLFLGALLWTVGLAAVFQVINAPMQTPPAPFGIVSLQVAWTPAKAQAILASWNERAYFLAAYSLGFDYLFIFSYALTLLSAALLVADRHRSGWFVRLAPWLTGAVFLAAASDVAENIGQTVQILNQQIGLAPFIGVCATVKFALLALAILYGLIGWLWPGPSAASS